MMQLYMRLKMYHFMKKGNATNAEDKNNRRSLC